MLNIRQASSLCRYYRLDNFADSKTSFGTNEPLKSKEFWLLVELLSEGYWVKLPEKVFMLQSAYSTIGLQHRKLR